MLRSMFQIFVKDSVKAVKFYQKAFDAKLECEYFDEDKKFYMHSELNINGQILAVSELTEQTPAKGNTMMFCLHFGKGNADKVYKIYDVLKEEAQPHKPVGDVGYSEHKFDLVDKYGVWWCVFE